MNTKQNESDFRDSELWGVHEIEAACHFSKSMAYKILRMPDAPVVRIGSRKYVHRRLFLQWLENQAEQQKQ